MLLSSQTFVAREHRKWFDCL